MGAILDYLNTETDIRGSDIPFLFLAAAVFACYRILVTKFIIRPISLRIEEKNREKFVHRLFDLTHYIFIFCSGTFAFSFRPYFRCPWYFLGCEVYSQQTGDYYVLTRAEKIYFVIFTAYYMSDVFWVKTTSDIFQMAFHHVCVFFMQMTSILSARPVIGLSAASLHDIGDVFLYLGKVLTYLKLKKPADISFIIFAALFLYLRLFNLAFIIYTYTFKDVGPSAHHHWAFTVSRCLLPSLYVCHIFWFKKIVKVAMRLVTQGTKAIRDTRSD